MRNLKAAKAYEMSEDDPNEDEKETRIRPLLHQQEEELIMLLQKEEEHQHRLQEDDERQSPLHAYEEA